MVSNSSRDKVTGIRSRCRNAVVAAASSKSVVNCSAPPSGRTNLPQPSVIKVLFYVPNLICYGRLFLLAAAAVNATSQPAAAVLLILLNFILDGVDGVAARRLGQTSAFGAFLDVAVDLASRGLVWSWAAPGGFGAAALLLEALTFACTHASSVSTWKESLHFASAPGWVRAVMADGFKSPAGCLAVAGLMGCPLWLWARRALPGGGPWSSPLLGAVLGAGRLLAAAVEVWLLGTHLRALVWRDAERAAVAGRATDGQVATGGAAAEVRAAPNGGTLTGNEAGAAAVTAGGAGVPMADVAGGPTGPSEAQEPKEP